MARTYRLIEVTNNKAERHWTTRFKVQRRTWFGWVQVYWSGSLDQARTTLHIKQRSRKAKTVRVLIEDTVFIGEPPVVNTTPVNIPTHTPLP